MCSPDEHLLKLSAYTSNCFRTQSRRLVQPSFRKTTAIAQSHNLVVLPSLEIELEEVASSVALIGEIEPDSRLELQHQVGYVAWNSSSNDIVEMKGRVTCEIRTGDKLLLTKLNFDGIFNSITKKQPAGLLSYLVFNSIYPLTCKQDSDTKLQSSWPLPACGAGVFPMYSYQHWQGLVRGETY